MQDGISPCRLKFGEFYYYKYGFSLKISKFNKSAGWNKGLQFGKFLKFNKVCCTIIRKTKIPTYFESVWGLLIQYFFRLRVYVWIRVDLQKDAIHLWHKHYPGYDTNAGQDGCPILEIKFLTSLGRVSIWDLHKSM